MNNFDNTAAATTDILDFIALWAFASPSFLAWCLDMNLDFVMDICRKLVNDGVLVSDGTDGRTFKADGFDLNLKLA